ncbi:RNA binding S1 [Nitrosococcus oceani ATCC 19707]|uniref:RNA binding S1 n=2 Tax=Nitrosococcus oceani TaxID=1229 RepID=Q3JBJ4_NITOC|nr:Tex family protein [Nitrosococcus oceani]ABA57802.1 RNA binding S1 [Nitrosococcus oceani ATCC 19707]EDZ67886.1 S1 RNA binding domain protein [Nitrosococcus oceani AFC27]KFI19766.1 transcription accessory protein [Nitrosococcus oceani C-27]GEM21667.1 RNA-binding protein [Nitrosococcus oceani]
MKSAEIIAQELEIQREQASAAICLLDEGATVPFVARYRKEATGGMDDTQLRYLESRLVYLRELEERRETIACSIEKQDKLTAELEQQLLAAMTKTELEDLYLPYKPKRRTKAQMAREAGLEPLALQLLENPELDPETIAADYLNPDKGIEEVSAALEGARRILMEHFAEEAGLLGQLREYLWKQGELRAKVQDGKGEQGCKFADYFDYQEAICKIPSHRALALFRGQNEGVLKLTLDTPAREGREEHPCEFMMAKHFGVREQGRPADAWLLQAVRWAWKIKLYPRLEADLKLRLREQAEETAIDVFSRNLRSLLLAAPAGPRPILGLDPGFRTGVKVAVIDETGKLLETATIYPHPPQKQWDAAIDILSSLLKKHRVELVGIGNGTASRETEQLVVELLKKFPQFELQKLLISEAGASVYSASAGAAQEFPDLDVSLRGAVSIARRLQDPLAELVKIDPKSIGVGQYQHDVNQSQLGRALVGAVEDCVNAVGVDINTASPALLSYVSGFTSTVARNTVEYRDTHGPFASREGLKQIPRFGVKTFEQAAGFLRIRGGDNPLDASAVHPETYPVVQKIMAATGRDIHRLIGHSDFLNSLDPALFIDEQFGLPTFQDILRELEKPGRDPRPAFKTAAFKEEIQTLEDLKPGMILEGVATNVTAFGAFVDVGVHQDGLVHISALADRFVKDPHEIVSAGDIVKVKVLEVDNVRQRIGLTMRLGEMEEKQSSQLAAKGHMKKTRRSKAKLPPTVQGGAMAEAFSRAKKST